MSAAISDSSPPGQFYCPTCEKNFEVGDRCPSDGTRLVKINVPIDPLLGRELDGRYQILQKLGQGGMGAVYRCQQLGLGREVAIKVVSAHLVAETEVVKRFLREAKLASRLSHPNAVAVLDFNQSEDGLFYLVMELVSGNTLDKVLETDKIMKPERIVRIGSQVCDALEGAHALSIVHRDLKPSNIMLLSRGRDLVKVLDFGLAKSVAPDQQNTTMTNAGALLGTPAFMCPELALGQPCDGRADLYSLGVVLYLMGTGQLPFISDSAHELIAMHASDDAPPMTGVPRALGAVVDRMLRKNPDDRYASAAEAREALEAALESSRMQTPPAGVAISQSGPSIGKSVVLPHAITEAPGTSPRGLGIAMSDTMVGSRENKSRWVIPAVIVAVVGLGGGAYLAMRDGTPAKPEAPVTLPATTMQQTPAPPPPLPPPIKVEAATGSANAPEVAVKPTAKPHKLRAIVKPRGVDRTVAHPPPIVEEVPPPVIDTKPQPKPGQGSGSGLPF
jgi:eukaryotic-like serine/threonine-protein kinase